MKRLRKLILVGLAGLLATDAYAVPIISATSGTVGTGNSFSISGSGFGSKSNGKYHIWADFSEGSTNPHSTLSRNTTWNATQRVATTGSNVRWGSSTSISTWDGTNNSTEFGTVLSSFGYGSKMYIGFWRRADFSYTGNWKWLRIWPGLAGGFSNVYIGDNEASDTGNRVWYVEPDTPVTGTNRTYCSGYTNPGSAWRFEEFLLEMNSSLGAVDGSFEIRINGVTVCSDSSFRFNTASNPSLPDGVYIQDTKSGTVSGSNTVWKDSIAVDDSWQRVYVSNSATYAAATHLEVQPTTAWSDTSITITQKLGTLTSGNRYLYVCDSNDSCNANGFPISSGGLSAPTITGLSPSNGPATGGTTVTLTGTGIQATPQITVGGIDATGETYVSATQMTFVTPAGLEDTTASVVIINPDSQSASFSGFSYDPEEATIDPVAEAFPWINN